MSIHQSLRYGASELRRAYNRNLGTALVLSIVFHAVLIGLYVVFINIGRAAPVVISDGGRPQWTLSAPPAAPDSHGGGPAGGRAGESGGLRARSMSGTPVASQDTSLLSATDPEIMLPGGTIGAIGDDRIGGGPGDPGTDTVGTSAPALAPPKHDPNMDEFVWVEHEPTWDPKELQGHLTYPEIASRNNIEGLVLVRALIGEDGRVTETHLDRTDNAMLSDAAIDAIRRTRFQPAIQNNVPVAVWIQIPVTFRLAN